MVESLSLYEEVDGNRNKTQNLGVVRLSAVRVKNAFHTRT